MGSLGTLHPNVGKGLQKPGQTLANVGVLDHDVLSGRRVLHACLGTIQVAERDKADRALSYLANRDGWRYSSTFDGKRGET